MEQINHCLLPTGLTNKNITQYWFCTNREQDEATIYVYFNDVSHQLYFSLEFLIEWKIQYFVKLVLSF